MVNFGPESAVPERFRSRTLYRHNDSVTLMRTTAAECREIGRRIAEQLTRAACPVILMLPLRGVSMLVAPCPQIHESMADPALFALVRKCAGPDADVRLTGRTPNAPETDL